MALLRLIVSCTPGRDRQTSMMWKQDFTLQRGEEERREEKIIHQKWGLDSHDTGFKVHLFPASTELHH